ncbi:MAG: NADPH-dependent glutamate synthase [Opitutales bacterium]
MSDSIHTNEMAQAQDNATCESSRKLEVATKITLEEAQALAKRCLNCKKPFCTLKGCPVHINIPAFVADILAGNPQEAYKKLKTQTALPAVCGRVCPQEKQCEGSCILNKMKKDPRPVSIGKLERFAADYVRENDLEELPQVAAATSKKVAIIGSGPAGITAAADLIVAGHQVEIFEASDIPGGVLTYGIPEFRLPKDIVLHEIEQIQKMGVKIHLNSPIGKEKTLATLREDMGFDAIFIAVGASVPKLMSIEGEDAIGVYKSTEFLAKYNLSRAFPEKGVEAIDAKNIVTIGGGNVAMDSSRVALRTGAKSTLVYRRMKEQMPARAVELLHAEEEGVHFELLTNPKRIIKDESGKIVAMECIKMGLGEPDDSGRQRPIEIAGSEFLIECDAAIIAIGNDPSDLIPSTSIGLRTSPWGTLEVNEETLETSLSGIYAGGDIVSGALTVISAMGQGKRAAASINEYLAK